MQEEEHSADAKPIAGNLNYLNAEILPEFNRADLIAIRVIFTAPGEIGELRLLAPDPVAVDISNGDKLMHFLRKALEEAGVAIVDTDPMNPHAKADAKQLTTMASNNYQRDKNRSEGVISAKPSEMILDAGMFKEQAEIAIGHLARFLSPSVGKDAFIHRINSLYEAMDPAKPALQTLGDLISLVKNESRMRREALESALSKLLPQVAVSRLMPEADAATHTAEHKKIISDIAKAIEESSPQDALAKVDAILVQYKLGGSEEGRKFLKMVLCDAPKNIPQQQI